jgi:hypothetical protein
VREMGDLIEVVEVGGGLALATFLYLLLRERWAYSDGELWRR